MDENKKQNRNLTRNLDNVSPVNLVILIIAWQAINLVHRFNQMIYTPLDRLMAQLDKGRK